MNWYLNEGYISKMIKFVVFVFLLIQEKFSCVNGDIEVGLIKQLLQKSYHQCVKECNNDKTCKSAKHIRLSAMCILYNVEHKTASGSGVTIYSRTGQSSSIQQCNKGEDCQNSCGNPQPIFSTKIFGNMVSIGAKIRYQCIDGSNSGISECLPNGSWSLTNITCNCSQPFDFIDGNNLTYSTTTGGGTELVFCRGESSAICNISSGSWYNISNCCNPCKARGLSFPHTKTMLIVTKYYKILYIACNITAIIYYINF